MDERFERLESRMDKFEEKMEQQMMAIIALTEKIGRG
jgi:tetrahydromethanopterin S-methyltransferase subunit G